MGEPDRAKTLKSGDRTGSGTRLREIAGMFLKLGVFGFGGPVAAMAMMEEQAVRSRGWITPEEFGEIYAVCKLLPGPVSTQMAIYLGRMRGSVMGGITAGVSYVLPSFVMVLGLAMLYAGTAIVQKAGSVLAGLQASALAIILLSTWALGAAYRRQVSAWVIAVVSSVIVYRYSGYEPLVILTAGAIGAWKAGRSGEGASVAGREPPSGSGERGRRRMRAWLGLGAGGLGAAGSSVLLKLFWMCFKAGFLVFGTGLAVVPVLEGEAVARYGWLTHSQFMDGLAVGQVTPGPVVITSTFIGYLTARLPGALAATFGMFLPSFINVLFLVPRVWRRFSGTPYARGFSAFAIPAVIGGILGTTTKLGFIVLTTWHPVAIFAASLLALILFKPPSWLLIPLAGVVGGVLGR